MQPTFKQVPPREAFFSTHTVCKKAEENYRGATEGKEILGNRRRLAISVYLKY